MSHVLSRLFIPKILAGIGMWCCLFFFPYGAQSATSDSATLQWAANQEPDLAGYRVYHGTTPGIYGIPQTIGKTTTYQYANLETNKTHYFTLTAYDTSGNESLPSPEVNKYIAVSSASGQPLPLARSGWVVWVDSEETAGENGRGSNAIDGNASTIWHTQWSGTVTPPPPHSLVVDLGAVATLGGIRALPRQNTSPNGQIGNYEFYVKTNSGTPPTTPPVLGEWTLVTSGTFPNTKVEQQVLFGAQTSRYVWLRALSEAQGTNNPWTSLAEFNVLGTFESGILPLGISPTAATVFTGGQQQFGGVNGVPPYIFSVQGDTTGGASITPAGLYKAGPHAGTSIIRVTDGAMPPAIAQATVTVLDVTPPSISLTSPTNGSTLSGKVTINATATDNSGVVGVQFRLNGTNLGAEDTTNPFSISWDTTGVAPGPYTLTAIVRDAAGNTTTSAPITVTVLDVTPPSISLTSPTNGSTLSGKVTINATATDNVEVVGVQFRLNGTNLGAEDTASPFSMSWDTTGVTPGPYTLTAIVRDAAGNTTTSAPLTISISSPPSTLTVSIAGSGSVTSSPNGIRCTGGTCSASYETGSSITLIAKAAAGWKFAGWSGACSGTSECVVRLSANQFVGATYSKNGNGGKNK